MKNGAKGEKRKGFGERRKKEEDKREGVGERRKEVKKGEKR